MRKNLSPDVVQFLLENPREVEIIQKKATRDRELAAWRADYARHYASAPQVPCGIYGCTRLKNQMDTFCTEYYKEYCADPDAYK
jgi:hypothetical protein